MPRPRPRPPRYLGLPDGSGRDLMQRLRATGRAAEGIALSGYGSERDLRRSADAGFRFHLVKPVPFEHLVATIQRLSPEPSDGGHSEAR